MSKKTRHHSVLSFSELRCKEVVNCVDGKRLGRIIDIVFGQRDGRIQGIVVPHTRRNIIFRNSEPIFISWGLVEKIGEDILLVKIIPDGGIGHGHSDHRHEEDHRDRDRDRERGRDRDRRRFDIDSYDSQDDDSDIDSGDYDNGQLRQDDRVEEIEKANDKPSISIRRESSKNFRPGIDCDNQCSRCMLFDCEHRWNK